MSDHSGGRLTIQVIAQAVAFFVGVFLLKLMIGHLPEGYWLVHFVLRFLAALIGVCVSAYVGMIVGGDRYWRPSVVFWVGLAYAILSLCAGGYFATLIFTLSVRLAIPMFVLAVIAVGVGCMFRRLMLPAGFVTLLICVPLAGTLFHEVDRPYGEAFVIFGGGFIVAVVIRVLQNGLHP